jgi:hypothetical protein
LDSPSHRGTIAGHKSLQSRPEERRKGKKNTLVACRSMASVRLSYCICHFSLQLVARSGKERSNLEHLQDDLYGHLDAVAFLTVCNAYLFHIVSQYLPVPSIFGTFERGLVASMAAVRWGGNSRHNGERLLPLRSGLLVLREVTLSAM